MLVVLSVRAPSKISRLGRFPPTLEKGWLLVGFDCAHHAPLWRVAAKDDSRQLNPAIK